MLRASELVGHESFAVVLADDVIDAETPCLRQLLDVHEFFGAPVLAVMEVPREQISAYGVVDAEAISHNGSKDRVYRIRDLVEKPKPEEAPSTRAHRERVSEVKTARMLAREKRSAGRLIVCVLAL